MRETRSTLLAALLALSTLAGGRALAQDVDCAAGGDGLPCWLSAPELSLQPTPSTLRFQARVSRAKLPSGDGVFGRLVVKLRRDGEAICSEEFRDVRVVASVINLEVGRHLGCALEEVLAESDEVLFQVCIGGPDNCLRPIPLGTTPYAVKAAFAREVAVSNRADVAARASYAHRLTADRELLPGRDPGIGYFDFHTPTGAPALHPEEGFLDYAAGGFLQWTPVQEEEPTLHIAARDHASGLPRPLYRLRLAALRTSTTHRVDVLRGGLHVIGDSEIDGATSVRGQLKVDPTRSGEPDGWLVAGNTGVTGTLTATERVEVEWNGIHVRGDSQVDGGLAVGGPLSVVPPVGGGSSGLAAAGDLAVRDVAEISGGLTVTSGRVTVAGAATVTGALSVADALDVPQDMMIGGDLVVQQEITGLAIGGASVLGPDGDPDGDGVASRDDNCPFTPNPEQEDPDLDGQGDACDPDRDGDGHANGWECWPDDPAAFPAVGTDATCDGVNDDCDHEIDEDYASEACDPGGVDPPPEACEGGETACEEGDVVCYVPVAEPLPEDGALGSTEGRPDRTATTCGAAGTPDLAYLYDNPAPRTLRFSVDHPETSFAAALELRRACHDPASVMDCSAAPGATVVVEAAEAGAWVAIVEGAGGGRAVRSTGQDLTLPVANGYRGNCAELQVPGQPSWGDGGNDAYEGWGQTTVTVDGVAVPLADVSVGERVVQVGDTPVRIHSSCTEGLWRLILEAADPAEAVTATVAVTGRLGSDGAESGFGDATFHERGVDVPYHWSQDSGQDPDLVWVALPGSLDELGRVVWQQDGEDVRVDLTDVTLPVVLYSAPSYAERDLVLDEIGDDLMLGAAQTGRFRLTVEVLDRCDGVDEDGDGEIDEDHLTEACNTGLAGICAAGELVCREGAAECVPGVQPGQQEEICDDDLDNNCNGQVDEGCVRWFFRDGGQIIGNAWVTCNQVTNNASYTECRYMRVDNTEIAAQNEPCVSGWHAGEPPALTGFCSERARGGSAAFELGCSDGGPLWGRMWYQEPDLMGNRWVSVGARHSVASIRCYY